MYHTTSFNAGRNPVALGLQARWVIVALSSIFGAFILFIPLQIFSILFALVVCITLAIGGIVAAFTLNRKFGDKGLNKYLSNKNLHSGVFYKKSIADCIVCDKKRKQNLKIKAKEGDDNDMGKIVRIEEVCPIYKIENDCIISKNGDLTIGFEITLPEIWTISAFDYDEIHKTWASAIQNLPDYTIVHKQDIYYDAAYKYEGKQETFLQRSYARHFDGRKYLKHRCYLFFTKSNKRVFSSMTVKT